MSAESFFLGPAPEFPASFEKLMPSTVLRQHTLRDDRGNLKVLTAQSDPKADQPKPTEDYKVYPASRLSELAPPGTHKYLRFVVTKNMELLFSDGDEEDNNKTKNVARHRDLANDEDVLTAGMVVVKDGEIIKFNQCTGTYRGSQNKRKDNFGSTIWLLAAAHYNHVPIGETVIIEDIHYTGVDDEKISRDALVELVETHEISAYKNQIIEANQKLTEVIERPGSHVDPRSRRPLEEKQDAAAEGNISLKRTMFSEENITPSTIKKARIQPPPAPRRRCASRLFQPAQEGRNPGHRLEMMLASAQPSQ